MLKKTKGGVQVLQKGYSHFTCEHEIKELRHELFDDDGEAFCQNCDIKYFVPFDSTQILVQNRN